MSAPEDGKLLEIAESISEGAGVDWDRVQTVDAPAGGVLRGLQTLERIAAFHRSSESSPSLVEHEAARRYQLPFKSWGQFTLLETIGEGSFGRVYRARDTKLQTDVALKLIPLPAGDAIKPSRALKEPRLLARVRHANVVNVHGADVIDRHVGVWMELIDGRTLAAQLRQHGPLSAREAALIGADLCHALAAVHAAGLIHGDVKARNVMRESGGRTVLMDFGTGKDIRLQPVNPAPGNDLAGTPLYLAPEVFRGERRSKLTDIYSLGVLLYHLVTNAYPVDGRTRAEVEAAHQRGSRSRLRDARPDLPGDFVATVERATAADPAPRFQTIGEFEAALSEFLGRRPVPVPVATHRNWWVAAAAIAVLAGVIVVRNVPRTVTPQSNAVVATAPPTIPTPTASSTYTIDTAMYRRRGSIETRLHSGDRVAPSDQIFARLQVSAPAYIYIVNEDDKGDAFVLFPLPGQSVENPIAAGTPTRIPGVGDGGVSWEVSTAGGREHFLIFASLERQRAIEEILASLPRAAFGRAATPAKLPAEGIRKLRGVGRLTTPAAPTGGLLASIFKVPLSDGPETTQGIWVRQLTVENPGRP